VKINVNRFVQDPSHCAVASIASIANYYNKDIDYKRTKSIANRLFRRRKGQPFEGLETQKMGLLLNAVGFNKVTIISSNLDFLDYDWSTKSKKALVELFFNKSKDKKCDYKWYCRWMYKFLIKNRQNNLIIDYNFGDYIRKSIDDGEPLIATFNWTMFFKQKRDKEEEAEEHAVVVHGYNEKEAMIIDSHVGSYKYGLKKYSKGFYNIGWENLMSVIGQGDLILASNYVGIKK
jgi:hypothetical protein